MGGASAGQSSCPPPVDCSKSKVKIPISIAQKMHEKMMKVVCEDIYYAWLKNSNKDPSKKGKSKEKPKAILLANLVTELATHIAEVDKATKAEAPPGSGKGAQSKGAQKGSPGQSSGKSSGKASSATMDLALGEKIHIDILNAIKGYVDTISKGNTPPKGNQAAESSSNSKTVLDLPKNDKGSGYTSKMISYKTYLLKAATANIASTQATEGLHISILQAVADHMNTIINNKGGKTKKKTPPKGGITLSQYQEKIKDLANSIGSLIVGVQAASTAVPASPASQQNTQKTSPPKKGFKGGGY